MRRVCMVAVALLAFASNAFAGGLPELRLDYATYNPLSLVLKEQKILEKAFEKDGTSIVWVQSLGSNKALEFLNASSLDFGSSAGAAALISKLNGNPIKSVYVYSRPEWTALATRKDSGIAKVEDLKGKRVAVTRGTDPHIFLVRALAGVGLTEKDVTVVPLQHQDGRAALERGDVDAWSGLDPMMAAAEVGGAVLFYRKPEANTWGILNVREEFATAHPDAVKKVIAAYEEARAWALAHPEDLKKLFAAITKLPDAVVERQIGARTDFSTSAIGEPQRESILAAGLALQQAGVIQQSVDVKAGVDSLIDTRFVIAAK